VRRALGEHRRAAGSAAHQALAGSKRGKRGRGALGRSGKSPNGRHGRHRGIEVRSHRCDDFGALRFGAGLPAQVVLLQRVHGEALVAA
jgi:hypothetical protein